MELATVDRPASAERNDREDYFLSDFIHNAWYMAMWSEDLAPGKLIERTVLNQPLVLFRRESGDPVALVNRCPHRFAPLSLGKLLPGDRIRCPYHGLEFGASGQCVLNPHAGQATPKRMATGSFPVAEKHSAVWVWMGDREPDPGTIPDYSAIDAADPSHVTKRDHIIINAHYQLVADNLLDLSHAIYLHDGLLANEQSTSASIKVEQDGDSVTVRRLASDVEVVGLHREYWPYDDFAADKFSYIRWQAPCYLMLRQGATRPGESEDDGVGYYGVHMLTPMTERTTLYHFMAVRFNVKTAAEKDAPINAKLEASRRYAFADQDAPIIEAQQRVLDAADRPLRPMLIGVDAGPVLCKRIMERLLAEDRTGPAQQHAAGA